MIIAPEAIDGLREKRTKALSDRDLPIENATPRIITFLLYATSYGSNSIYYSRQMASYLPEAFVHKTQEDPEWLDKIEEYNSGRSNTLTVDGEEVTVRELARRMLREVVEDLDELSIMLFTMSIAQDDPGKVTYWMNTKVGLRERTVSIAKFLGRLVHKWKFRISPEEIEEIATRMPIMYGDGRYEIELSDDIVSTYNEEYFGSCMFNKDAIEFYEAQSPDNVQVLRIVDSLTGDLAGRALVWHNVEVAGSDETITLLDRVYPSDGGKHIKAALKYADEKRWFHKTRQSLDSDVTAPNKNLRVAITPTREFYPYMDTFQFSTPKEDYLYFGGSMAFNAFVREGKETPGSLYSWTSTGGYTPWPSDDAFYDHLDDDEYHDDYYEDED